MHIGRVAAKRYLVSSSLNVMRMVRPRRLRESQE